jgi:outer membrane protein assembly factor BamB
LADGGIRVFAVEPESGQIRWTRRLDSLPVKNFYASSGLEFDNFDLLQQAGDAVAMSRWSFDRTTGEMNCKPRDAFIALKGEGLNVLTPRGCWSYAPRHQPRHRRETPQRGLAVFRANTLLGCLDDGRTVYRRDFHLDQGEKFDPTWMTGWAAGENSKKDHGEYWLSHRLAKQATWSVPVFTESERKQRVVALVWAGDSLFAAGNEGGLIEFAAADGKVTARTSLDTPVWDGMAAANGRLFVSTQNGDVVCLGKEY